MRWIRKLRLRLRSLLRSSQVEQELDEELRYHLEHLVDDYVAAGMSPMDARNAALREMGAIEQRKEECRDARGLVLVDSLRQDRHTRCARFGRARDSAPSRSCRSRSASARTRRSSRS